MSLTPREPDGLVVEDAHGNRLLAVPTQLLEILRFASVIQYTRGACTFRLHVPDWNDPTPAPAYVPQQPSDPGAGAYLVAVPSPSPTTPPPLPAQVTNWVCPDPLCGIVNGPEVVRCTMCHAPRPQGR